MKGLEPSTFCMAIGWSDPPRAEFHLQITRTGIRAPRGALRGGPQSHGADNAREPNAFEFGHQRRSDVPSQQLRHDRAGVDHDVPIAGVRRPGRTSRSGGGAATHASVDHLHRDAVDCRGARLLAALHRPRSASEPPTRSSRRSDQLSARGSPLRVVVTGTTSVSEPCTKQLSCATRISSAIFSGGSGETTLI